MKAWKWPWKILIAGFAVALLGGCAASPYGPYYAAPGPPPVSPAPGSGSEFLSVGPHDHFYVMNVENNTPFQLRFPKADHELYQKGYDRVRRERNADFSINVAVFSEARDNPNLRGEQVLGGAILGAATGALLGAAAGAPVTGTIAGAAGGGVLGAAAPAATPMVRIDVSIHSLRSRASSHRSVVVDMAHVPPYDVPRVVDIQLSRMFQDLPAR